MRQQVEAAILLLMTGDRDGARRRFATLWEAIGASGDPISRCLLAHHMADLQDDPREELRWDQRALVAADEAAAAQKASEHLPTTFDLATFYPSLHLNLAEVHRKLGALSDARDHLARAQMAVDVLPTTEYGAMIRGGIARLAERLT
jgi:hypothetical protein